MNSSSEPDVVPKEEDEEDEDVEPPRNFTAKQLVYFNGEEDERTGEVKRVYLSVNGTVFDVSDGRNFYGPDGPYASFAGRECGVALAKMSFDAAHLDDLAGCKDLSYGEKDELDNWVYKFTYHRNYPIKGRLVADESLKSLAGRTLTREDLSKQKGDAEEIPEGFATAPIYIGAGNKVFDASFGGVEFYGKQRKIVRSGICAMPAFDDDFPMETKLRLAVFLLPTTTTMH
jgi:membrane-associated progesterone receptor component